jgi:DNA invertase Pin-like site-specific DNA recombinase
MVNVQGQSLRNSKEAQAAKSQLSVLRPMDLRKIAKSLRLHKKDRFCAGSMTETTGRRIAYMRVSTAEQSTDRQTLGLKDLCDEFYPESISAVAEKRPVFEEVLAMLRPGDTLVVWDLDRAFRSTIDALLIMESLRERGIHLHIVSMFIDTTTDEGELFYTFLAGIAQYERRVISRRTREGIEAARRKGAQIGRPRLLDEESVRLAHSWIVGEGLSCQNAADLIGVNRMTLQRAFKRHELTYPRS